jgi:2-oxoisovalerate dehydrogenase E1 component
MTVFDSTEELYQVMGLLFERIAQDPQIAPGLLEGKMVVRFRWVDPEGQATIDLRQETIAYSFGPSELQADVEMIQSADTAHQFWLGELNVPQAIATRKVISRGSVPKALKLLPAVQPAFDIYRQTLVELGKGDAIPSGAVGEGRKPRQGLWERLFPRKRAAPAPSDPQSLNRHYIPMHEGDFSIEPPEPRGAALPEDEAGLKREMLRRMMLIRAFEEHLSQAFAEGQLPTEAIHLSIGQEASAVGACFALQEADSMTSTHRGHGHMLAKGADLDGMMAEIYGKASGLCRGKGGSMHVTDAHVGALGANGIVGASPVIAAGAALAYRQEGSQRVSLAFMGDGATNQGMFHEALNFAAVFDLPALFVIENNLYGEFTPLAKHTRVARLVDRAAAYGIPGEQVDGNDPWTVYQATRQAAARARDGEGPSLIECLTYRWHGHMEGEQVDYRPQEEIEAWKARDPITSWRKRLMADGLLSEAQAEAMQVETDRLVGTAVERAIAAAAPPLEWLTQDIYAPDEASLYRPARTPEASRSISCSEALWEALAEEMGRDPDVFLMGEDVSGGGYFAVSRGLDEEFVGRVLDTPISEYAIGGAAVGAAMSGKRPVAELLFSDFITTCMDPIVNQAAKLRYMSGGQYALPLVIRTPGGAGLGMAAQHSQSLEALLTGIPGLIIIAPSTPADAKGLLKAAIRSNNPVLFFENKLLYLEVGPVPTGEYITPIGVAEVKRPGRDVTLVSLGGMLPLAMNVAEGLAVEGLEVEVIDPRTLVPLDFASILGSVGRTGRLVVLEEGCLTHGFGAEIIARVAETAPNLLKAPARRVAALDAPLAYARELERAALPDEEKLRRALLGETERANQP